MTYGAHNNYYEYVYMYTHTIECLSQAASWASDELYMVCVIGLNV